MEGPGLRIVRHLPALRQLSYRLSGCIHRDQRFPYIENYAAVVGVIHARRHIPVARQDNLIVRIHGRFCGLFL